MQQSKKYLDYNCIHLSLTTDANCKLEFKPASVDNNKNPPASRTYFATYLAEDKHPHLVPVSILNDRHVVSVESFKRSMRSLMLHNMAALDLIDNILHNCTYTL